MKSKLTGFIEKKAESLISGSEPEVRLWYCRISSILKLLFDPGKKSDFFKDYNGIRNKTIDAQEFSIPFLSDSEFQLLNSFKSIKKQVEWLSGRFLLKGCLHCHVNSIDLFRGIKIAYETKGAPFLPDFPDIKVSVSHSGDIAAVGVCTDSGIDIGIDIEKLGKKPDKNFLSTAFTKREINDLDNSVKGILTKWTAKEAFLKYIRQGFNESLHRVEVLGNSILHNNSRVDAALFSRVIEDDYVLSMVTGRSGTAGKI